MNRITKKLTPQACKKYNISEELITVYKHKYFLILDENEQNTYKSAFNKLGQYEDIEELCEKLEKQPFYVKNSWGIEKDDFINDFDILYSFKEKRIEIYNRSYGEYQGCLYIEDYGKNWAMTKKELENDC